MKLPFRPNTVRGGCAPRSRRTRALSAPRSRGRRRGRSPRSCPASSTASDRGGYGIERRVDAAGSRYVSISRVRPPARRPRSHRHDRASAARPRGRSRGGGGARGARSAAALRSRARRRQQSRDSRVTDGRVLVLVRIRRPRAEQSAARPHQVGARAADHGAVVTARGEEPLRVGGVAPAHRGDVAPDLCPREHQLRRDREEPRAAAAALIGRGNVSMVSGPASGPPPSIVAFIRPKNPAACTLPCLIGRNHQ